MFLLASVLPMTSVRWLPHFGQTGGASGRFSAPTPSLKWAMVSYKGPTITPAAHDGVRQRNCSARSHLRFENDFVIARDCADSPHVRAELLLGKWTSLPLDGASIVVRAISRLRLRPRPACRSVWCGTMDAATDLQVDIRPEDEQPPICRSVLDTLRTAASSDQYRARRHKRSIRTKSTTTQLV